MEKKFLYGAIVFLVLVFFGYLLYEYGVIPTDYIVYSDEITLEDKYCEVYNDCRMIDPDCCPHVSISLVAVNVVAEQKVKEWKANNCVACKFQDDSLMSPGSNITQQICEQNQCQLKQLSCELICNETQEQNKELESDLIRIGMTKEQAMQSCRC